MNSGSMYIPGATLYIDESAAHGVPPDKALEAAQSALHREKSSRTVSEGNVRFLEEWIAKHLEGLVTKTLAPGPESQVEATEESEAPPSAAPTAPESKDLETT